MPIGVYQRPSLEQKFWEHVQKTDGCWLWIGARNSEGYGYLRFNYAQLRAHRVSWELHFGPIPDGLFVLHHCDNPPCVNPSHLFLGTNGDNMLDAINKGYAIGGSEKGRCAGEKNSHAKLTKAQVKEIRVRLRNYRRGLVVQLAKEFGISKSTIMSIWKERSWKTTFL